MVIQFRGKSITGGGGKEQTLRKARASGILGRRPRMSDSKEDSEDEARLEKLYSELTGASEACARNVFMFVCCNDAESERSHGH